MQASFEAEAYGKAEALRNKKKLEKDISELETELEVANRNRAELEKSSKKFQLQIFELQQVWVGLTISYYSFKSALLFNF